MTDGKGLKRPTILILDDEKDMCEFVADVADERGLVAAWCDHIEDFPNRFTIDIQAIFLDLVMPGMDGIEIIRFLADNKCQAKLVLMTGYDIHVLDSARRLAENRGLSVAGVLRKPFSLAELNHAFGDLTVTERPSPRKAVVGGLPPQVSETDLRRAISEARLVPFFQPKVRLATREVVGAEVLARWHHPQHGQIPPDIFIPLAESSGTIEALTETIICQALDCNRLWLHQNRQMALAINISPHSLWNLEFPDIMLARVISAPMPSPSI